MAREEYETWPNIDEFEIYQKSNLKRLARCYRTHSDLGWCGVNLSDDISLVSHLIFLVKKQPNFREKYYMEEIFNSVL